MKKECSCNFCKTLEYILETTNIPSPESLHFVFKKLGSLNEHNKKNEFSA